MGQDGPDQRGGGRMDRYDLSTATEVPRQAVMIMQYVFLTFSLIGLAGSLFKLTS